MINGGVKDDEQQEYDAWISSDVEPVHPDYIKLSAGKAIYKYGHKWMQEQSRRFKLISEGGNGR